MSWVITWSVHTLVYLILLGHFSLIVDHVCLFRISGVSTRQGSAWSMLYLQLQLRLYRDPSGDFRSILAYNCNNNGCAGDTLKSCTRVQRFSNIASNYNGKAIGTSQINNARRINEIKGTIANYYPPAPTPPPTPSPTPPPPSPSSCMSGDTRVNTATSN